MERSDDYANFDSESKKFMSEIGTTDDGRCFVLEILEVEDIIPYMICVKAPTPESSKKLLKDIRNAYTELVISMPLE